MKKTVALMLGLCATASVFAQTTLCNNGSPAPTGGNYAVTANMFVVRTFPIRCSANVQAVSRENAIAFAVGAVSLKGNNRFQGTTSGGPIQGATCTNATVCVAADADNGLQGKLDLAT